MSGIAIRIEANGLDTLAAKLEAMTERAVNMTPLMARFGAELLGSVFANFAAEGRPEKWAPLSASTVRSMENDAVEAAQNTARWKNAKSDATRGNIESARIAKDVGRHKILVRSGALRQSIMVGEVTNDSVEIGSSIPYARIHQLGGTIGPVTVRPKNKQALAFPTADGTVVVRSANTPERKIPGRPYLKIQDEDIKLFIGLTMDYIREGAV
ncbi:phage virion morphogenesis protein [Alicyclobacillus fastidiosus]|uniref:Phage virion morphogenesis protein n=1 Tax=Alicyclobacillus fastidiosus TaxID=392011 RepID=A0ABV5AKJ3_9BACL|nr:phage virion morphogenesis protein [Alicyclobacillus fastidiosus]WEH08187.1 phage virion morphogenesis protein [Alicyclobacillus fastidiosus]